MNLLQRITSQTGINNKIFQHLKISVQKIKNPLDKYCTLLFDEISLSADLKYIPHQDKIVGFEDLYDQRYTKKI